VGRVDGNLGQVCQAVDDLAHGKTHGPAVGQGGNPHLILRL